MTQRALQRASLELLSTSLRVAAIGNHDRLTIPQLLFFLTVAEADFSGRIITFTEIKQGLGDTIGRSLHTTYKTLLEPRGRTNLNGIGWIKAEANPDDLRQRFLSLTEIGRTIASDMAEAILK